jgi:hypothetical protein
MIPQGVDDHLQRRPRRGRPLRVRAPGAEQEVEGDQHQVEEEDEEQEVLGEEGAQGCRLGQRQHQVVEARPVGLPQGREGDGERPQQRRQQHQEEAYPVDAEPVVDAEPGDPGRVDHPLQAGGAGIEVAYQCDPEAEGHEGSEERDPPRKPPRRQERQRPAGQRRPQQEAQHRGPLMCSG